MKTFSTNQAAKQLGIAVSTLSRYISDKKIPAPKIVEIGGLHVHSWSEKDIQRVRALLPKIANGRKTRYQKQKPEVRSQKSAKATAKAKPKSKKKPQPRTPQPRHAQNRRKSGTPEAVPHEQRRSKH